jgi:hypothetical protein
LGLAEGGAKELDIGNGCLGRLGPGAAKHLRLDVDGEDGTLGADGLGDWNGKPPRATTGIENVQAGRKFEEGNGRVRTAPGKRIVDHPAKPRWAWEAAAPRNGAPDQRYGDD